MPWLSRGDGVCCKVTPNFDRDSHVFDVILLQGLEGSREMERIAIWINLDFGCSAQWWGSLVAIFARDK